MASCSAGRWWPPTLVTPFPTNFSSGQTNSRPAGSTSAGQAGCMHAPGADGRLTDIRAMTTELNVLDRDALHTTFETWAAEEESLDAQLRESLEALAAY